MAVALIILLWMEQLVSGDLDHRDKRWLKYYYGIMDENIF